MINLMNCFLVVTVSVDRKERRLKGFGGIASYSAKIDKKSSIKKTVSNQNNIFKNNIIQYINH